MADLAILIELINSVDQRYCLPLESAIRDALRLRKIDRLKLSLCLLERNGTVWETYSAAGERFAGDSLRTLIDEVPE